MDKPKRKLFVYRKTETDPKDVKAGDIFTFEPAFEGDPINPNEYYFAEEDAALVPEIQDYGIKASRLTKDISFGAQPPQNETQQVKE